jgi:hypothetical protein
MPLRWRLRQFGGNALILQKNLLHLARTLLAKEQNIIESVFKPAPYIPNQAVTLFTSPRGSAAFSLLLKVRALRLPSAIFCFWVSDFRD